MKPGEIVTQFAEAILSFDNIIGQPTDSDIVRLFETMAHILLTIPYDEAHAKDSLIGLIYSKAEYMAEFTLEFIHPTKPWIYDTTIPNDTTDGLRAMKEAVHKLVRSNYGLYEAAEQGAHQLILEVVEDTYIHDLKHSRFFFSCLVDAIIVAHCLVDGLFHDT